LKLLKVAHKKNLVRRESKRVLGKGLAPGEAVNLDLIARGKNRSDGSFGGQKRSEGHRSGLGCDEKGGSKKMRPITPLETGHDLSRSVLTDIVRTCA